MGIITVLHILVSFALILIVLLQAGKGAEMGAAFGGASQTLFGSAGAMGFLSKLTTVVAVIFMITSLLLAFSSTRKASIVMKGRPIQSVPVAPPTDSCSTSVTFRSAKEIEFSINSREFAKFIRFV